MNFGKKLISFIIIFTCSVLPFVFLINLVGASSMWTQTYGGPHEDQATSVIQTNDGGFALAGYTESFGAGLADFWLVKTDTNGNMEWSQTYGYGGTSCDEANSVVQTSDGGFALAGGMNSSRGFWVVKTDSSGNMEWNQTYGEGAASSLIVTSDGGFAIAGYSELVGSNLAEFWLVKTDANGNMEWNKKYGEGAVGSVIEASDGGYVLVGGNRLVKTDSNGNMEWNQTYGEGTLDCLVATSDGGYALAGYTTSFGAGGGDFWLVKTDSNGNMEWNQVYGGVDWERAYGLVSTSDGGYALAGHVSYSHMPMSNDIWFVKTDGSGNIQWSQIYGGDNSEHWEITHSLIETSDGGYALAGYTTSFGAGSQDCWLIKTDELGIIPEFSSWVLVPVFLALTTVVLIYRKNMKHKSVKKQVISLVNSKLNNLRRERVSRGLQGVFFMRTTLFFGENYKAHLSS